MTGTGRRCGKCDAPVESQIVSPADQIIERGYWKVILVTVENLPCGHARFCEPGNERSALA